MTLHANKVLTLPESGKVVLAHPSREADAIKRAEVEDAPYMLRRIIPESHIFVLDSGALFVWDS